MNTRRLVMITLLTVALAIVACEPVGVSTVRGGGAITLEDGSRATFGFTMACDPETAEASGQFQYVDHGNGVRFHGVVDSTYDMITCEPGGTDGAFAGTYKPQPKGGGGRFVVGVRDNGEPGVSPGDEIGIELVGGAHNGYFAWGTISRGNIQSFK
jgi:hypothetical protein